jgi:hypothetical protein
MPFYRRLVLCLIATALETHSHACAHGDSNDLADCQEEDTSLVQIATLSRISAKKRRVRSEMVRTSSADDPRFHDAMPPAVINPESVGDCHAILGVLKSQQNMSEVATLLNYICDDPIAKDMLTQMREGCLYVMTDEFMDKLYEDVEHPNVYHWVPQFADWHFPVDANAVCPHEMTTAVTSTGGAKYTPCAGGFAAVDGSCIAATLLGAVDTQRGKIRVHTVSGLLITEPEWRSLLLEAREPAIPDMPASLLLSNATQTSQTRTASVPLRFVVCVGQGASGPSDQQIDQQIDALNEGFAGNNRCVNSAGADFTVYTPDFANSGLQFTLEAIERVEDARCSGSCRRNIDGIVDSYAQQESGKIKILVCTDTSVLGLATFPWYGGRQFCMVNEDTLPGGATNGYNLGDTLTHELGHYLGLLHTFNGGCGSGDGVADTAQEAEPYSGCPSSSTWRRSCSSGDPAHNFMDYSSDRCMCTFTQGQSDRMWSNIQAHMQDIWALSTDGGTTETTLAPQTTRAPPVDGPYFTGTCRIDSDGCATSGNWPTNYANKEECEVTAVGSKGRGIKVESFATEQKYDTLTVNGHTYSGTNGPADGIVLDQPIKWVSDFSETASGWKICFQTGTTPPTETRPYFTGTCTIDSAGCATSGNWPNNYGNKENCEVTAVSSEGRGIRVEAFATEQGYDKLTVNGRTYDGTKGPADGIVLNQPIKWVSDVSETASGWKICFLS